MDKNYKDYGECYVCKKQIIPNIEGFIPAHFYYCGDKCWNCLNKKINDEKNN